MEKEGLVFLRLLPANYKPFLFRVAFSSAIYERNSVYFSVDINAGLQERPEVFMVFQSVILHSDTNLFHDGNTRWKFFSE